MKKFFLLLLFPVLLQAATPSSSTLSSSGTEPAGDKSTTWIFSSNFTGTVLGVAYAGATDSSIDINAPHGERLDAIAYTVTAGSIRLIRVK